LGDQQDPRRRHARGEGHLLDHVDELPLLEIVVPRLAGAEAGEHRGRHHVAGEVPKADPDRDHRRHPGQE